MKKHMRFIAPLIGLALIVIFAAGSKISDYRKLGDNLLAAIGLQNVISSQGTASSTSGGVPDSTSTPTLADALQQLQDQVQSLSNQMTDLRSKIGIINLRSIFTRILKRGDTGDDVSKLQELLMRFPELYSSDVDVSSTVTGFYGSLTKAAVMQFQSQAELQETGIFGTSTMEKFYESLNTLAQDSTSTEFIPIDISSIAGLNNSKDLQGSTAALQDQISQLASDSTSTQANVAGLQNQISQLSSDLENAKMEIADLQNQLAALQPTPSPAATSPSPSPSPTPSPPASVTTFAISNIQITNIVQHSATVTWVTNSSSTSEVDYSMNSSLPSDQTHIVSNTAAVTSHLIQLQNLNSGTKYYYRALSKNNTNATASSTVQSFTTLK